MNFSCRAQCFWLPADGSKVLEFPKWPKNLSKDTDLLFKNLYHNKCVCSACPRPQSLSCRCFPTPAHAQRIQPTTHQIFTTLSLQTPQTTQGTVFYIINCWTFFKGIDWKKNNICHHWLNHNQFSWGWVNTKIEFLFWCKLNLFLFTQMHLYAAQVCAAAVAYRSVYG